MIVNELQAKRNKSRRCNEDILINSGFAKIGTSSLYKKDGKAYILSPGIGKGRHGKYWFDIRLENSTVEIKIRLAQRHGCYSASCPIRLRSFPYSRIREKMKQNTQEDRAHTGKVWGFYCELNEKKQENKDFRQELMKTPHLAPRYALTVVALKGSTGAGGNLIQASRRASLHTSPEAKRWLVCK